jgi:hypothetical protein
MRYRRGLRQVKAEVTTGSILARVFVCAALRHEPALNSEVNFLNVKSAGWQKA